MKKLLILFLLISTITFGQAELLNNNISIPIASYTGKQLKDDLIRGYHISPFDTVSSFQVSDSMQLGTIATINLETGKIDIQKLPVDEASKASAKLFWEGWEQYFMTRIEHERMVLNDKAVEKIDGIAEVVIEQSKMLSLISTHRAGQMLVSSQSLEILIGQMKILDERQKLLNDHFLKNFKRDTNLSMFNIVLNIIFIIIIVMFLKRKLDK